MTNFDQSERAKFEKYWFSDEYRNNLGKDHPAIDIAWRAWLKTAIHNARRIEWSPKPDDIYIV